MGVYVKTATGLAPAVTVPAPPVTNQDVADILAEDGPAKTGLLASTTATTLPLIRARTIERDGALHPFSNESFWNTSIGSGATYESSEATQTASFLTGSAFINSNNGYGVPISIANANDPVATVTVSNSGNPFTYTHRIPSAAVIASGTDQNLIVIDGDYVYDYWIAAKTSDTVYTANYATKTRLDGAGTSTGIRAAGWPVLAGCIRLHEIDMLDIPHALNLALPRTKMATGPVWPATGQDGYTGDYTGTIPMGTMFAIPTSVDLTSLGLSPEGYALGVALQQFGAYVGDSAGQVALYAEDAVESLRYTAYTRMSTDFTTTLRPLMRRVTNSTSTTVGGGGTRLRDKFGPVTRRPGLTEAAVRNIVSASGTGAFVKPTRGVGNYPLVAGVGVQGATLLNNTARWQFVYIDGVKRLSGYQVDVATAGAGTFSFAMHTKGGSLIAGTTATVATDTGTRTATLATPASLTAGWYMVSIGITGATTVPTTWNVTTTPHEDLYPDYGQAHSPASPFVAYTGTFNGTWSASAYSNINGVTPNAPKVWGTFLT